MVRRGDAQAGPGSRGAALGYLSNAHARSDREGVASMVGFIGDALASTPLWAPSSRRAAVGMEGGLLLLTVYTHGDKELEAAATGNVP